MSKFIAIDLDPQGLFVAVGTVRPGNVKVEQAVAWAGTEAEGGPPLLTAENARRIGEQLRDRLRAAGVGQAPVVVTVGRDRVILKEIRYPNVPPSEEPAVVRFQAIKELSDSPDDVILDYVPLSNGAGAGEKRSLVVAIRKDLYQAIRAMCEAATLKLSAVTPRPYAIVGGLARAFATGAAPPPESKNDAVAVLTVGPGGGEFSIARGGEVTFTKSVPAPVIASESMLLAEVRRNLTMYAGSNPGHPVQSLYVAEADGEWAGLLRTALGIPVHAYDPLAGSVPSVPEPTRGRFAGAAGLLAATSSVLPINFVTPRQPKADADPKKTQIYIAAAAALLLVLAGGVVGWQMLSAQDREYAQLAAERDAKRDQLTGLEPDRKRLDAVDTWKKRRVVWLDEIFDMADRLQTTDSFHAVSFVGKSIAPDAKTGKQDIQAEISVKVSAKDVAPVNALAKSIDADNGGKKGKYYVGVDKTIGSATPGEPGAKDYTIIARVVSRPSADYARFPNFVKPDRKAYPPPVSNPKAKEKEKEPEDKEKDPPTVTDPKDKVAPPPKEKETAGE